MGERNNVIPFPQERLEKPTEEMIRYALGEAATHEMVIDVLLELVEQERAKRRAVLARVGMGHTDLA